MRLVPALLVVAMAGGVRADLAPTELTPSWGNLEGLWLFRTDPQDVGENEGWQKPEFDDSGWRTLSVPGVWEAQGVTDPRPGQPPKPKGTLSWTDYDGVAWYRLRFIVPAEWAGQELSLRLGSVDDFDRTFLNGQLVGETGEGTENAVHVRRKYSVSASAVRFGQENVLAIRVVDGGGPGGLIGPELTLLPRRMAEAVMRLPPADRPLEERFADPPAASRILKIIHPWPDQAEAQDALIDSLIAQGFGGVVCNVSFDQYLESEAKWEAFTRAVRRAKDAGMSLWLYDEKGYPSGTAGGITLRDRPEWEARGLLIADTTTDGGPVELDLPPGEPVMVAAFPRSDAGIDLGKPVDLADQVRDGRLSWEAAAGRWHVMAITEDRLYEGTHVSVSFGDRIPYINLLMPEPTARFIEVTHARYAAHLGDDLGRWFVSTFTDEPSLMSLFMRRMPYRPLPWARSLPEEFRKRRGYALEPMIPGLIADADGAERKVRYDFWLTVAELVSENYFGQIQQWCRGHNVLSGGHLLMEGAVTEDVALYGDFFRCVRRTDAPSIDCLTSLPPEVPWTQARMIGSVADLEGRTVTMCETSDFHQRYRPPGDERPIRVVTEDEIRGTCNRLMLGGISTITSYYSFDGLSSRQLRELNLWVGRCSTMLAGGHQVTDIAMLFPVESVWPRFTPARGGATDSSSAMQIQRTFDTAAYSLYEARRDFTYIDSATLAEAKVEKGTLAHGALRWRVVVLPGADTLPTGTWEKLARFWRQGGVVVGLGAMPAHSEQDFPSAHVEALGREMLGDGEGAGVVTNAAGGVGVFLPVGSEAMLPLVLDEVLEADVKTADPGSPIRVTHRRIDGRDVYFIINDSADACEDVLRVAAEGQGELWDPATGSITPLPDGVVKVNLKPYGGVLLRYPAARTPRRRKVESGGLPGLTLTPLPITQPSPVNGEFVRAEVAEDPELAQADRPAWRATGAITKGQVDTFLFLKFSYEPALDLRDAACLLLDTWVPEGQGTAANVLVILADRDGGQYLADTGRSIGSPGHCQSTLSLGSFKLAGWSQDADGRLDLEDVTQISIGWGGYYGREGEGVEFSLGLPRLGRLNR